MNDVIVQFARLWGQHEVFVVFWNNRDEIVAKKLRAYNSEECLNILSKWAEEYLAQNEVGDTVEFFDTKLEELVSQ